MKALLLVDIQNDFCPGGALPVKEGDQIVPLANALQTRFELVVATQDWHPKDHLSFASNQGKKVGDVVKLGGLDQVLWPDHCVQNTFGAEFVNTFDRKKIQRVFHKGTDKNIDSYSGFFDNGHKRSTGLGEYLKEKKVDTVFIAGLATDYCVKYSTLDALRLGFKVYVVEDACRGVELKPGDAAAAWAEMKSAGAHLIKSAEIK